MMDLTAELGAGYPIFGFSQDWQVVAALSRAGGVGVMGVKRRTPDQLREELAQLKRASEGKPFGVNLVFRESRPQGADGHDDGIPDAYRSYVHELGERFALPGAAGGLPMNQRTARGSVEELVHLSVAAGAAFVTSGLGIPSPDVRAIIRDGGALYGATVGSPRHVRHQLAAEADFLIAQGSEAAGHVGKVSTFTLVPQVVDAAEGRPVIAAGGIADGRQIAAALALGASGAWLGTALLATVESSAPDMLKRRLTQARSEDAVITRALTGQDERALATPWIKAWEEEGALEPLAPPRQAELIAETLVSIVENKREDLVSTAVGQSVGMINDIPTVRELVERMVRQWRDGRAA